MMDTSKTNFVKQYEPDNQARVELKNGRILDVINGRYFDAGTSIILQDGKIESMPGLAGEPRVPAGFTIDLKGKTLISGADQYTLPPHPVRTHYGPGYF